MKNTILILFAVALVGCNPFISKDVRKAKRCNKKLERLTEKCPELLKTDNVEVIVPEIVIEKQIEIKLDTVRIDSFIFELDRITEQKDKITYVATYLKEAYTLDTLITDSSYNATISIKNGVLSFNIKVKERTIKVEDKIIVPIKLTWYDKLLIYTTKYWWLLIVATLIYLFVKFGYKILFKL